MEVLYSILPVAGRFILVTGLLMALYWLMWRKQATYRAKRIYLLTMPLVALVISLLQVEVYQPDPVVITVEQTSQALPVVSMKPASAPASETSVALPVSPVVTDVEEAASSASVDEAPLSDRFQPWHAVALVYTLVLIGLCLPLIAGFVHLHFLRKKASVQKDEQNNVRIWVGELIKAPFSFHRSIYLPQSLTENQRRMILTHERAHILHRHYVDVWISSVVTRLLWWNPFLWWACAELRNVHEFEADSVVLGTGEDVYAYQAILIEEVLHGDIVIANGFNHSFIRRRFIEMVQSSNRRMSVWAKAGSAAWMLMVVALFCCTVGEAETVYRTVTVDTSQPVMMEVPSTGTEAVDSSMTTEETLLSLVELSEDVASEEAVDDTIKNIIVTKVVNGEVTTDSLALSNDEQNALLGSLLGTLGSLQELTPEQYEELQKQTVDSLPSLEYINHSVNLIKNMMNSEFTNTISDLQSRFLRTQMIALLNSGLVDSKNITDFSVSAHIGNPKVKSDMLKTLVMDFLMEWLIINRELTEEEYNQEKNSSSYPELYPSLERLNKDARERRIERTTFYVKQINQLEGPDGKVATQLLNLKDEYGNSPGNRDLEFTIEYPDTKLMYQKKGRGIQITDLNRNENHTIERSVSRRIIPSAPLQPSRNESFRQAKENEFVIEGYVDENITDSCYLIYLADEYLKIQDEPVDTVPVVNKRFTYVLNTDKMTAGRLRCIFPGGKICDNTISLYFVPGETVKLYVHNGFYDIEKGPEYPDKVSRGMEMIREKTRWKTPHLPEVKGRAWKNVTDDTDPYLDVREVYFNDEETVLRIACRQYTETMSFGDKTFIEDNKGRRYKLKRALNGYINSNNEQHTRVFGIYLAFEPVREDIKFLTFHGGGREVENIREAKQGRIIY
jgi:beta-lactamase regulating signal transducer with metallopeptidase domain